MFFLFSFFVPLENHTLFGGAIIGNSYINVIFASVVFSYQNCFNLFLKLYVLKSYQSHFIEHCSFIRRSLSCSLLVNVCSPSLMMSVPALSLGSLTTPPPVTSDPSQILTRTGMRYCKLNLDRLFVVFCTRL